MGTELTKAKLKSLIYKETEKYTFGTIYNDDFWNGPQNIWNTFDNLNLDWNFTKESKYEYDQKISRMPVRKIWNFEIKCQNSKGKIVTHYGCLTASGAGSVQDPLEKYDLVLVI